LIIHFEFLIGFLPTSFSIFIQKFIIIILIYSINFKYNYQKYFSSNQQA